MVAQTRGVGGGVEKEMGSRQTREVEKVKWIGHDM